MQELRAIYTFGCELWGVLVHIHAHQPVTDLLIGPFRHWPVLPLIILPCRDWIVIQSLQKRQMPRVGFRNIKYTIAFVWVLWLFISFDKIIKAHLSKKIKIKINNYKPNWKRNLHHLNNVFCNCSLKKKLLLSSEWKIHFRRIKYTVKSLNITMLRI